MANFFARNPDLSLVVVLPDGFAVAEGHRRQGFGARRFARAPEADELT